MMKFLSMVLFSISLQASGDSLQQCAVDLCGKPSELNTPYLNPGNVSRYVPAEAMSRLPEVKEVSENAYNSLIARTQMLILKSKQMNFKRELARWTDIEWKNFKSSLQYNFEEVYEEAGGDSPCGKACKKRLEKFVTEEVVGTAIPRLQGQLINPDKKSFLWNCQTSFLSSFVNSPEVNIEPVTDEVESDLVNLVKDVFGTNAAKTFEEFLKREVTYDTGSGDNISGNFLDYLRENSKPVTENPSAAEMISMLLRYHMIEKGSFELFAPIRAGATPSSVSGDAYDEQENVIALSPFTLYNPFEGKSTIAHELGHTLSDAAFNNGLGTLATEKMQKIRQCVNSSVAEEVPADIPQSWDGDLMITEEDFADLIAQKLYPENALKDSCALMRMDVTQTNYTEATLDREGDESHSSALLRVIRAAHATGKELPSSCKEALSQRKDIILKQCL